MANKQTSVSLSEAMIDEVKAEAERAGVKTWTVYVSVLLRRGLDAAKADRKNAG